MRPVKLIVTAVFALVVVLLWWTSDAQAGVAAWRTPSGRENRDMSSAGSGQRVTQGKRARFERKIDTSQPASGHGSSALVVGSRTTILAAGCTGLGLVVVVTVAVSLKQAPANKKMRNRRVERQFKARTWVELTESPQF
jgi:hypothetical protein